MRLYSEYIRKYPQDFITVVEALSHTGALAIQNASMYKALKEDKRSLEEDIWSHRHYFGSSGLSVLLGIAQYHRLVEEIEKQKTLHWLILSLEIFMYSPSLPLKKGRGKKTQFENLLSQMVG